MDEIKIQSLLDEISEINAQYKQKEKETGDDFNVFSFLKLQTDEVRVHSRFIAGLLNPKGMHHNGGTFLRLFLNQLQPSQYSDKEILNAKVIVEEDKGVISEDKTKGGRIDIVIKLEETVIVIENKIYAPDQDKQLIRYKNEYPLSNLYYLTLEGHSPCNSSVCNCIDGNEKRLEEKKDYFLISYKNEILSWLELCQKETEAFKPLQESINQYMKVIKELTNQAPNNTMEIKIIRIILMKKENFESAKFIAGEFEEAKIKLLTEFWTQVKDKLKNEKDLESSFKTEGKDGLNLKGRCPALFIHTSNANVFVGMEPLNGKHWKNDYNNLFIGVFDTTNKTGDGPFPQWSNLSQPYYNFEAFDTLEKILPGTNSRNEIINEIFKLVNEKIEFLKRPNGLI